MERRSEDDVDRFRNPTVSSPWNLPMPENPFERLPPLPENNPFGHYQYESNPYDNLEAEFNHLNLSNPSLHSPFLAQSSLGLGRGRGGSILGNNSLIDSSSVNRSRLYPCTDENWYRLRVQSAVIGQNQMGLYLEQPNDVETGLGGVLHNNNLSSKNSILDYQYNLQNGVGIRTGSDFVSPMNRYPTQIRPQSSNQNGFQSGYNLGYESPRNSNRNNNGFRVEENYLGRGRSSKRFEDGHSDYLLSPSAYNNNNNNNNNRLYPLKHRIGELTSRLILPITREEIEAIFLEVKDYVRELMVYQPGSDLINKLFEVCNSEQMSQMLLLVTSNEHYLMSICCNTHGTRSMQKLLQHLTTPEQKSLVISVLKRITVSLAKDMNGYHVIQHCLKLFSNEETTQLLNVVVENCLVIAINKSGCCVLQQCVTHAEGEAKERLMSEITANALVLSENEYGNYVVQYIVGMRVRRVTSNVLARLAGSFVFLSMNKFGSNVVEKFFKEAGEDHVAQIVDEIVNSQNFLMVLQDPFGNYVAQTALKTLQGALRQKLVNCIQDHYPFLHSHPFGKRVLSKTRGNKQRL